MMPPALLSSRSAEIGKLAKAPELSVLEQACPRICDVSLSMTVISLSEIVLICCTTTLISLMSWHVWRGGAAKTTVISTAMTEMAVKGFILVAWKLTGFT